MTALQPRADAGSPAGPGRAAAPDSEHYCPMEMLARFTLLMAGHGRCVSTDMMLGDRDYAMGQLACARTLQDGELAQVAQRLVDYFDDPRQARAHVLGTA
jgi:hypothetical protein